MVPIRRAGSLALKEAAHGVAGWVADRLEIEVGYESYAEA